MKNYKAWTTLDVKFLQVGFFPQGRSPRACRVFCKRNGIPFAGKREFDENERLVKRIEEKFNQPERHDMVKANKNKNANLQTLETASIYDNDDNPRTRIENVDDLKASIKASGLLQPIVVRSIGKNRWKVVAGSRRLKACRELKFDTIPCVVIEANDDRAYELATAENIVRENMTAVDEANAVSKLFAQGKSRTEIAAMFGKSARWAEGRKRIAELGGKAMEYLAAGKINLGHAEVLTMCCPEDVERWLLSATWKSPEDLKHDIMNAKPLLDRAPFDPKKVCKNCENRTDKQLDLFGDVQCSYCLDKECYLNNVKKEAEHWRKKFIKEGLEEVPEDDRDDAQYEYNGYVSTSSEDDDDSEFVKECIAKNMKPMFWVNDDTAEWGHVFRREGYELDDEDNDNEESEPVVDKNSWSYQISHMNYSRSSKVRNEASAEEKRIVADKLKGVFGNISRTAKAFILEILNYSYADEDGNEETYLKHQHDAEDDFLDGVAEQIVNWYDGVNSDIREFLEMESREEFERTANDKIPEDEENDKEKEN
jgi:ParB/RepB/Spo0J family partition protein